MIRRTLLIASFLLTVFFCVGKPSVWYEGQHDFVQRTEPLKGDDDSVYYHTAERFWRLPHDPGFVQLHPNFSALLDAYPVRGIGLGSLVLLFQRTWGNGQWRKPYTQFILLFNVAAFVLLAYGLASTMKSFVLWPPLCALAIDRFSMMISYPTAWCTEAVTRGMVALLFGLFFLFVNTTQNRRRTIFFSFGIISTIVLLCVFKIQWILGCMAMSGVLLLHAKTRWAAAVVLAGVLFSFILVRSINAFGFNGNKELFAGSGMYALTWSPEGADILRIGCEQNRFSEQLRKTICAASPETLWATILNSQTSAHDQAHFFEECSRINSELALKNITSRLKRIAINSKEVVKGILFGIVPPTKMKKIKMAALGFLSLLSFFFLGREEVIQVMAYYAFVFGAVVIPTMSVLVFYEYRYYVPVRGLFCVLPILCIVKASYRFILRRAG